jgi:hypothetical protein
VFRAAELCAGYFFLLVQKEVTKKNDTPMPWPTATLKIFLFLTVRAYATSMLRAAHLTIQVK